MNQQSFCRPFTLHCGSCGRPLTVCVCVPKAAPAPAAPMPVAPAPVERVVQRYGVDYCPICDLDARYCRGHAPSDPPAPDGTDSDLHKRIVEARAKAGGR